MGKKTLKEKLASETRRKNLVDSLHYTPSYLGTLPISVSAAIAHPTDSASGYQYVLNDLRRIFVLAALAFCAQVVLWYYLR